MGATGGCWGTCVQTTHRSQPGTMELVPWEPFLSEQLQVQQTLGPREWAVTRSTHGC